MDDNRVHLVARGTLHLSHLHLKAQEERSRKLLTSAKRKRQATATSKLRPNLVQLILQEVPLIN